MMNLSDEAEITVKSRAIEKLKRDMGPLILETLADSKTAEIMLNPDGKLWVERFGEPMTQIGTVSTSRAMSIITTIAGYHNKEVTTGKPILECELPTDASRFAGQLSPIVVAPAFAIRKKAIAIFTLSEYVKAKIMSETQYDAICNAVKNHKNILVIGGTGSGKTTLVNAVINEMVLTSPFERVFIIEDTGEIQCAAKNSVTYHTTIEV